jgi:succinylglutamate desuccinylase
MLKIYHHVPPGFLDSPASGLVEVLGGPSLMHLPGRRERPLFVSVLLHGNEDTGLIAVQNLLRSFKDRELPRALSVFVGNVEAARYGLRRLDEQPDYNRIWPGGEFEPTPESQMLERVVDEMRAREVFAAVDIHNNTGTNPHYACVNRLDHRYLHLATLFSRTVVYFIRPTGVASIAMGRLCPSITVECGKAGQPHAETHASDFLEGCIHLSELPEHKVAEHDIELYHTVAQVRVPEQVSFGFGSEPREMDILFDPEIDHMNFREVPAGTVLGRVRPGSDAHLLACSEAGMEVGDTYFEVGEGELALRKPVMPSMLTQDARIIRQDCLCYLMERLPPEAISR